MLILWAEIKSLIDLFSFTMNIFTWSVYCCIGEFLYYKSIRKTFFNISQLYLLIHIILFPLVFEIENPCQHLYWALVLLKKPRYCTSIGRISNKINVHWTKFCFQCSILFQDSIQWFVFYSWFFFVKNFEEIICQFSYRVFANSNYTIYRFIVIFLIIWLKYVVLSRNWFFTYHSTVEL